MKNGRLDQKRMQNHFEIEDSLRALLEIDQLFELSFDICEQSLNDLPSENQQLAIAILTLQEKVLKITASRRHSDSDRKLTFDLEKEGTLSKVWHDGKARLLVEPLKNLQLSVFNESQNSQTDYCISLDIAEETFGLMLFSHPDPDFFNDDRKQKIKTIGRQLSLMLRNAKLFNSIEKKKKLFARIETLSRNLLARQIHDGLAQSSATIAMHIHLIRRKLAKNVLEDGNEDELAKIEDFARKTTKEIRYLLFTLKPEILETGGFVAVVQDLAKQSEDLVGIRIHLDIDSGALKNMEFERQSMLFTIVVDAIEDARNQSGAKKIWISLKKEDEESTTMQIKDDGISIKYSSEEEVINPGEESSLQIIQDRIQILEGRFTIIGNKSAGKTMNIWVPDIGRSR